MADPSTSPSGSGNDGLITSALQGGSVGNPPVVPGYASFNGSSGGIGTGMVPGDSISVGPYTITLTGDIQASDTVPTSAGRGSQVSQGQSDTGNIKAGLGGKQSTTTVQQLIQEFASWSLTQYQQFKQQAYQAGLITSANANKAEVLTAWQLVVQEASKDRLTTDQLLKNATNGGWNAMNPAYVTGDVGLPSTGNSYNAPDAPANGTTQTSYISYMDPATVQGTLADSYYRLLGRMPTQEEYQKELNDVYQYENDANTGKFESKSTTSGGSNSSPDGKSTNTSENIVSQRGIGTRGAEFLAGQAAMNDPDYGRYQAATTYFHAFMQALAGPAAGMQASGPTVTSP
jgi:hypothetical protein